MLVDQKIVLFLDEVEVPTEWDTSALNLVMIIKHQRAS